MRLLQDIVSVAWKEIQVIVRDRGMLAVVFLLPLLMGSLFGGINLQLAGGEQPDILVRVGLVNQDEGGFGDQLAKALGERKGQPKWFSILQAVTETRAMKRRARRGVQPNVDFWSGAIYYLLGIPEDLYVPVFALGRIPGWTLHVMEQYANNILLRPLLLYTGPRDLEYVPIDQRG